VRSQSPFALVATILFLSVVFPRVAPSQDRRPLTVEETIRRVLETHPRVRTAAEAVRASRGSRLTARSWANPTLNYQVEDEPATTAHGTPLVERKVMAFAMVPLEPIYQLPSRSARASAEVRRADANLQEIRRQLVIGSANAFYRVAMSHVAVDAGEDVRGWLDSLVSYTQARVKEGAAAEADLIRLEVERGRVETDLAMARVELMRARGDLGVLVGIDSVDVVPPPDSAARATALPPLDALLAVARRNRPDVVAADAAVDATRAGVAVERSAIVREIGAMAGVMEMAGRRSLMAGVSLPFPLFDQNRGEVQRASAERRAAEFERSLVGRQVNADVATAYASVRELSAVVRRLGPGFVRRAEEGRRIAEGAYREGATPLIQVLDAARAFADARMLYYRALFAWRQSIVELNAAIGSEELTTLPRAEVR
jgi:cobalt-zinc-cadmium efflux system outer membrane protein